ncbi:sugar kinase [Prauserella marina]|uniref:Sugar kinase of the NBD/HSP70 family, may contain an N-terminal HTH domain n=1 Tax=Prauserella marina TaxID=530584 RepID=A0A222VRY3_9PSEU|nr:ROK family transcriptional regulator [Prauserella marina]ASR36481.1 sugar kinase [Prauserella marina]PWV73853.1 putative NBD/HSP70 family sugar kinase [Prauserella marina]SDD57511.1 Sugar kinase of the NBD/HSP70 family, may contain an N-terminal HTH domain [Prauserella marina]
MTQARPAGQHTVRRHNCALVLAAIADSPGRSRADVAASTGLTKATVSTLVDRLAGGGLITESGRQDRPGPGRRGTSLSLSPRGPHGLGVEIAVDYIATCLAGLTGEVRELRVRRADNRSLSTARVLGRAGKAVREALAEATARGIAVGGVGVAVPGLVEEPTGLLRVAPNLGWHDVDLPAELAARTELPAGPVLVGNEANFAALAQLWTSGPDGARDFVHVSGEIGIGAGIVIGGQLFSGTRGFGGELGHFPVSSRGPRCTCGARGCLETLAGQEAIAAKAGVAGLTELVAALSAGERPARSAVREAAGRLGTALSSVLNLLDVPCVVLGGSYARLHPWLAEPLLAALRARVTGAPWSPVTVTASALGSEAAVRGAASSAVRGIMADPDSFVAS